MNLVALDYVSLMQRLFRHCFDNKFLGNFSCLALISRYVLVTQPQLSLLLMSRGDVLLASITAGSTRLQHAPMGLPRLGGRRTRFIPNAPREMLRGTIRFLYKHSSTIRAGES